MPTKNKPTPDQIEQFLKRISFIESSSGKNLNHKEIKSGIHAGDTAIGEYGLMPNTLEMIRNRAFRDNDFKGLEPFKKSSTEELDVAARNDGELQKEFAKRYAQDILSRMNEEQGSYAWQYGDHLSPEKMEEQNYQNSPRIAAYRRALDNEKKAQSSFRPINEVQLPKQEESDREIFKKLNAMLNGSKA